MRIRSIDLIRGLCILLMLITHGLHAWLTYSSKWFFILFGVTFGSICANGFVFVSGMGSGLSWVKSERTSVSNKDRYLRPLSSGIVLLTVSVVYNFFATILGPEEGWQTFTWWYLFQCLAVCRLLSLAFLKIKTKWGICAVVCFIALSGILLAGIDYGETTDPLKTFLFTLFYAPLHQYPILVYFPFYLMGMLVGKEIQTYIENPDASPDLIKRWLSASGMFMIVGLILGLQSWSLDLGWEIIAWLKTYPSGPITELPFFLFLNTYAWCFFFTGFQILGAMLLLYYFDIRHNKQSPSSTPKKGLLELFGQYSLTIYIGHMILYLFTPELDYLVVWGPIVALILVVTACIWLLERFGKGKFSLEYLIGILEKGLYHKFQIKAGLKGTSKDN